MNEKTEDLIAEARRLIADCQAYNFGLYNADKLAHQVAPKLADALEAAIERARSIHYETEGVHCHTVCAHRYCKDDSGDQHRWPCSTIQALDGAPEPEGRWEYGLLVEALGDTEPESYPTRESAQHVIDHPEMYRKWTHDNPVTMRRRRPAGPWLPVEGEKP